MDFYQILLFVLGWLTVLGAFLNESDFKVFKNAVAIFAAAYGTWGFFVFLFMFFNDHTPKITLLKIGFYKFVLGDYFYKYVSKKLIKGEWVLCDYRSLEGNNFDFSGVVSMFVKKGQKTEFDSSSEVVEFNDVNDNIYNLYSPDGKFTRWLKISDYLNSPDKGEFTMGASSGDLWVELRCSGLTIDIFAKHKSVGEYHKVFSKNCNNREFRIILKFFYFWKEVEGATVGCSFYRRPTKFNGEVIVFHSIPLSKYFELCTTEEYEVRRVFVEKSFLVEGIERADIFMKSCVGSLSPLLGFGLSKKVYELICHYVPYSTENEILISKVVAKIMVSKCESSFYDLSNWKRKRFCVDLSYILSASGRWCLSHLSKVNPSCFVKKMVLDFVAEIPENDKSVLIMSDQPRRLDKERLLKCEKENIRDLEYFSYRTMKNNMERIKEKLKSGKITEKIYNSIESIQRKVNKSYSNYPMTKSLSRADLYEDCVSKSGCYKSALLRLKPEFRELKKPSIIEGITSVRKATKWDGPKAISVEEGSTLDKIELYPSCPASYRVKEKPGSANRKKFRRPVKRFVIEAPCKIDFFSENKFSCLSDLEEWMEKDTHIFLRAQKKSEILSWVHRITSLKKNLCEKNEKLEKGKGKGEEKEKRMETEVEKKEEESGKRKTEETQCQIEQSKGVDSMVKHHEMEEVISSNEGSTSSVKDVEMAPPDIEDYAEGVPLREIEKTNEIFNHPFIKYHYNRETTLLMKDKDGFYLKDGINSLHIDIFRLINLHSLIIHRGVSLKSKSNVYPFGPMLKNIDFFSKISKNSTELNGQTFKEMGGFLKEKMALKREFRLEAAKNIPYKTINPRVADGLMLICKYSDENLDTRNWTDDKVKELLQKFLCKNADLDTFIER
jgi:hypothetical protein